MVQYLGVHAPASQMNEKLKLMYGSVTSFDVLMQNFYRLQHTRAERVPDFVAQLEGALNVIQCKHPHMLNME